jgi:serine phosphatase RsbU (regulator of sigma subunit)
MDIAICTFDNESNKVEYAGANRSLYLIKDGVFNEIKPTKRPIGGDQMEEERAYLNNVIALEKGMSIYMSTDGYADQFGGPNGKKFMVKRFQQLLLDMNKLSMEQQGITLHKTIEDWRGTNSQVDDILVIGIKV